MLDKVIHLRHHRSGKVSPFNSGKDNLVRAEINPAGLVKVIWNQIKVVLFICPGGAGGFDEGEARTVCLSHCIIGIRSNLISINIPAPNSATAFARNVLKKYYPDFNLYDE
jgi:hypothetical protein